MHSRSVIGHHVGDLDFDRVSVVGFNGWTWERVVDQDGSASEHAIRGDLVDG